MTLSGKVILWTAAISNQTTVADREVWDADEFHRHTQVTMHSNLKDINNQDAVP